jgi:hypothetical protein
MSATSRNPFTAFALTAAIGDTFASGGTVTTVIGDEPTTSGRLLMFTMLTDNGEHVDTWQAQYPGV